MLIRLVGGAIAVMIALGVLLVPSPARVEAASSCTGWTSSLVPPTTIRVLRTATKRTQVVNFRTYVEKVMPAEWGSSHPVAVLQAGAVTIKQYAWYYALAGHWRGGRDATGQCYDVRDDSVDQVYSPTRTPAASHLLAVEATWAWSVRRGDALVLTGYWPGTSVACGTSVTGYRLYQLEASRCASVNRWTAEQILRTYYSPRTSPAAVAIPGENDMTGDDRGDAIALTTDTGSGEATGRLFTGDPAVDPADVAAAAGQVLTTVSPGALLGRGTADLDADGRLDLVQLVAGADDTVSVQVMGATGAGLAPAETWWTSATGQFTGQLSLVTGDFSGDGRGDAGILERDPSRTKLWLLTSTGTAFAWQSWRLSVARDLTAAVAVAGDFSGDGRDDVAFLVPDGPPEAPTATVIEVAVSGKVDTRGVTTLYLRDPAPWSTEPAPPATIQAVAGDIDRTGRDDLLLLRQVSGDAVRVLGAYSTGSAFTRRWIFTATGDPIPWSKVKAVATDLWKDARADLLLFMDLGADEGGASLGTRLLRLRSYGTYLGAQPAWLTDPALDWTTLAPF